MIIITADRVIGKRVARTLGLVRGNTIRARHIGEDIMAVMRNIVGGEVSEYTKLLAESREQALDRMVDEARGLGANAIISLRFSTSMIMGGSAELLGLRYGGRPGGRTLARPRGGSQPVEKSRCMRPPRHPVRPCYFFSAMMPTIGGVERNAAGFCSRSCHSVSNAASSAVVNRPHSTSRGA